jgi:hypothetical protein
MISIPDASIQQTLNNPYGITVDLDTLSQEGEDFNYSIPIPLALNGTVGAAVDSILVRSGLLTFSATSPYPGMIWNADLRADTVSGWQVSTDESIPITTWDLTGQMLPVNPASNSIPMQLTLTIRQSTGIIQPGPVVDIGVRITDLQYDAIYGYLGKFSVQAGPQSLPVDFFSRTAGGTFHFRDPELKISFRNSFGLPIQVDTLSFMAIGREGQVSAITGSGIPGPTDHRILAYPGWGQEGQTARDSIVLDNGNTDLFDVLGTSPGEIMVEMAGSTNPYGETHDNFLLDTSRLSISSRLLLPLDGYADLLLIADTLDFVFGDFYDNPPQEIRRLFFRLDFISQFPVDISTQLYFTDQAYQVLDSLFHDEGDPRKIVEGAPVDASGIAVAYHPEPVEIELSREQIDNISACYFIIAKGRVTTTGYNPPDNITDVRFYSYYFFHTYIGAIAELEMNSDDY